MDQPSYVSPVFSPLLRTLPATSAGGEHYPWGSLFTNGRRTNCVALIPLPIGVPITFNKGYAWLGAFGQFIRYVYVLGGFSATIPPVLRNEMW